MDDDFIDDDEKFWEEVDLAWEEYETYKLLGEKPRNCGHLGG